MRDGSFRADRHAGLLVGPLLDDEELAELQRAYRTAGSDEDARLLAIMFAGKTRKPRGRAPRLAPGPAQSGEEVAAFFEQNLMHAKGPKAGEPFVLEPWQWAFVDEFYKRDEEGRRVYRLGILGVPRGNAKSPLAAGLALYELLTRPDSPDLFCAAGSRDQARIVFGFARSFVESGPLLDSLRVGRNELVYPAAAGSLRVISSEGALQFGHSVSCAFIDEAHVFKSAKQAELWTSMETALHKRVDSFLLAITTAGHDKLTTLGRLYDTAIEQLALRHPDDCFTIGRDEDNGVLLWWYGAAEDADVDDETVWRRCNPASWVSMRELRRQRNSPGTSEASFRRLHLNSWTAGTDEGRWIDPAAWKTLADPDSSIEEGASVTVGMDGSRTFDTTVVAVACEAEDGRIDVGARVFSVRADAPHHVLHQGGRVNFEDVESYVIDLFDRFHVLEAAYDPKYLDRSAEIIDVRMPEASIFAVEPSSKMMREALSAFERGISEGTVRHCADPVVAAHLAAAGVDRGESGEVRRIYKMDRSRPIDATVAIALAYWRAARQASSVYAESGLVVL